MTFEGSLEELSAVVRRVEVPAELAKPDLPPGVDLLQENVEGSHRQLILFASAERWLAPDFPFPDSTPLSLEDIFVAMTRGSLEAL